MFFKAGQRYRAKNHDDVVERKKIYYIANRDVIAIKNGQYHQANRDSILLMMRQYYQRNKDSLNKKSRQYYVINRMAILEQKRIYNFENRVIINEKNKIYYHSNIEVCVERHRKYYKENKEVLREKNKQWRTNHPEEQRVNNQRRRARILKLPHTLTVVEWLWIKQQFDNKCCFCGKGGPMTHEHFVAATKDGEYTRDNIIPSCPSCNNSKYNHNPLIWYRRQSFYTKAREDKILKHLGYKDHKQQLRIF